MTLSYLSDDEIGRQLRAKKKTSHKSKPTRAQKELNKRHRKDTRKKKRKKIGKIGLLPSRAAFLVLLELNALKVATLMARVYKKNPSAVQEFWVKKLGGNWDKFKSALAKGSKQQISADVIGVALEASIATALPIILMVVKFFKEHKVKPTSEEQKELSDGIKTGKEEMLKNPDFEKTTASVPEGENVMVTTKDTGDKDTTKDKDGKEKDTAMGSFCSPLGISWSILLYTGLLNSHLENPVLIFINQLIALYGLIGFIMMPIYAFNLFGWEEKIFPYYEVPVLAFKKLISYGKESGKKIFS